MISFSDQHITGMIFNCLFEGFRLGGVIDMYSNSILEKSKLCEVDQL